jgi:cation-transporting ATPase E
MLPLFKKFKKEINKEHFPVNLETGLTSEQVQQRIDDGLVNKTKKHVTKSYLRIVYENVFNFFNILLFAIIAAMIVARIPIEKFLFAGILVLNIGIGLYQDIRARKLIDKLKVVSSVKVNVLRDGEYKEIKANQVVLSDIIAIKQGNQLVCDGTIVDGFVELNESLLTGESKNISKTINDGVYSGSFVSAGHALYRVDRLGKENYAEKLQQNASKFKRVNSEMLLSLKKIFKIIGFVVVALGIAQIIKYRNDLTDIHSDVFTETVSSISTSLVGMTPIGMYLLTSVTLAVGVIRLVRRNMLTQDMYCIETLARVDTLCLDKTGTLTDGNLNVLKVVSTSDTSEKDLAKIIKTLVDATKDENATARAIKKEFENLNNFDSYSAIPFNSERKYSAVMLEDGRSIVMGAREFIPHSNKEVDEMCREYEKDGMRVLVLAQHSHVISIDEKLEESQVIGFIVLQDHIRDDALANIKWFKENGVNIRIITGDNPESAAEIARRAGIDGADKFISLEGMSLEEVRHVTRDYIIFGRVTPEQKEVIIEALKDDGHTVAMTGDGVNDILALRVADCSIAMASGSDAAKNVAHLVSLDSSFSSLPDVVREGRRVINNLQRTVSVFLIKTVFAAVLTFLFLVGAFKLSAKYPFDLANMYLWEILCIGIGSLFLSLQPNDEQIKSKFLMNVVFRIIPASTVQIGLVIFFFIYCKDATAAQTLSVLAFSIFSFIIFIRVCLPFDVYRVFLVVGLTFVGTIATIADIFAKQIDFFGLKYSIFKGNSHYVTALCISLLVALIVYGGLSVAVSKLHIYIDKKREERKYDHF